MSAIPSNLARVPALLAGNIVLGGTTRTNIDLLNLTAQMASGKKISRPSDDSVRATSIAVIQDRLERLDQRLRNLSSAQNNLDYLDSSLGDTSDLVLEAKSIASSQIGVTSDAATRQSQAVVIDEMLRQVLTLANRQTNNVHIFGGSTPGKPPIEEVNVAGGGYRYVAQGDGLYLDLGSAEQIPVTLGGSVLGETSVRLESTADLSPNLTGATRVSDIRGARGQGVTLGVISFSFDGGPSAEVDLSGADTAQDIADRLTSAIQQYETDNGVTILGPGGVSFANGALSIDVVPAPIPPGPPDPQLVFTDVGSGVTAQDLGLTAAPFEDTLSNGSDLDPKLTLLTPLSSLPGVAGSLPLDSIRFKFTRGSNSSSTVVDLSSAQTIGDLQSLIQTAVPGVRVKINDDGTAIDIVNEIAGPGLTIEEVAGGVDTATLLGVRSFSASTAGSDFNSGRGVRIVDNVADPVTGLIDPAKNVDFTITLGDGSSFGVDLRPQDLDTVQTIIARINAEAATAVTNGDIAAGSFSAGLTDDANGIAFNDLLGLGAINVAKANNSAAAEDLGLLNGAYDVANQVFLAQDRATVRVDNLFTSLMDLRDALRNDDSSGITLAGEHLESIVDRIASARALVGVYSQRVELQTHRLEDQKVLEEQVRGQLQDLDYADASIRYSQLRTQLQAAYTVGSQATSLSLLDFLS